MNKTLLRLIVMTQIFTLFFLMILPSLIRLLNELSGKILYALLVVISIGLALALRYALDSIE